MTTETKSKMIVREVTDEMPDTSTQTTPTPDGTNPPAPENPDASAQSPEKPVEKPTEKPAEKQTPEQPTLEINDELVLKFFKEKKGKELSTLEELFVTPEPLPEDAAAYAKYTKETGRGLEDFLKIQRDIEKIPEQEKISEYLMAKEGYDAEDLEHVMRKYEYDEDVDDPDEVADKKIKRKQLLKEATNYLNEQKEKYKAPLESNAKAIDPETSSIVEQYKQAQEAHKKQTEIEQKQSELFTSLTDQVFSNEFKGFEFNLDGKKEVVEFGNPAELKEKHSTPMNFIKNFLDENGFLKDAAGYHRALAVAMNPDKIAQHFYELGKADAIENDAKESKNINMSSQKSNYGAKSTSGKGINVRYIDND